MADLENSSNIYADLAQSSYIGRPNPLPYESLLKKKNVISWTTMNQFHLIFQKPKMRMEMIL